LALLKLPEGMEALYDRMGTGIARTSSPKDLAFTTTVLQTVTCSLRILSLAELSQAMGEDASRMLNFQRSVVDLCRGFVVIDNGGNVAMIHQTAREYLLGGGDRPFKIERDVAHKQLFASCMRALTSSGLRAKIQGNQTPDFLNYAASSWSSHLVSSPVGDEDTVGLLNKFLTGNWVLTWIHFLAHSGKLRILVRASQHLSKYFSRRRENISSMDEEGHQFIKHELLQNWAIDFLKIVGKFGASLRRDPMAIYKAIPPFCPRNSSIYQLFGKTEARHIAISGLSTELWDDSLARISLGTGIYASSIAAAGCQIAILVSSGTVFIYDSTTFEEAPSSPIQHGERLFRMELNSNGTLLSTYGYRTTKVWDIPTGKCRLAVDNIESRPRPLSILWTNDNTRLLVGTDDRRVRALDLTEASPTWQLVAELEEPELEGHFLNSSSYMAFNKDGTLVAVAYRGHPMSAWEIDGPSHIAHCWRKREKVTAGQVIQAVWHPHTPELLGLYIEGIIFKWRPYEGEVEELATNASRLSMSRDGNLFATGDVRGAVKVYTTSDLGLLYQLTSEDNVLSLTFSPDMRRLYDLRGYYANAWEPDALIKYADQRGKDQDVGSERGSLAPSLGTSLNPSKRIDAVTVLAHSPNGFLYCCGTENGNVRLYDTRQQFPSDVYKSKGFLSVENMCWSPDGRYLCLSDSGKKVMIVAITSQPGGAEQAVHQIKGEVSMRAVTTGPILQLLFHPDSSQLCVHSSSRIHVISLATFSVTQSLDLAATETKWITHPQDANLLIGIGPGTICVLDWSFGHHRNYRFECAWEPTALEKQDGLQPQLGVDRVLGTADKKHVLVQISRRTGNSRDKSLLCFDAPSLSVSTVSTPATDAGQDVLSITPITLAHDLSSEVGMCLYFLPQNRLVFLSKSFSVCTARISATQIGTGAPILPPGGMHRQERTTTARNPLMNAQSGHAAESPALKSMRRLFSLPGDWINKDSMLLSSIWAAERSFMCPKNGEVAVVRCAELA
jgi:WD40 repeat protein